MPLHNEHGGLVIRQSDLASYSRCPQQKHLADVAAGQGRRAQTLSATVYGTVAHHALRTLEELAHAGRPDALPVAQATFAHYWLPENIGELEPGGIDIWLPRQTYGGLREKGLRMLADYAELLDADRGKLLALEYQWSVPLILPTGPLVEVPASAGGQERAGVVHTITGTVDRMSQRLDRKAPYLNVEDFKSGKQPTYLRYNAQFTVYCWASTQRAFWDGFDDPQLGYDTTAGWARRGTWIDLASVKRVDAGWRVAADYGRLMVALTEYVRAVEAGVYPLNMKGDTCLYCPFAHDGSCGGIPIVTDAEAGL